MDDVRAPEEEEGRCGVVRGDDIKHLLPKELVLVDASGGFIVLAALPAVVVTLGGSIVHPEVSDREAMLAPVGGVARCVVDGSPVVCHGVFGELV